jgi:DHA2 family multidrug resistance protein
MSLLFVPLTTIAMDAIPREKMGYATSMFSLMRNIGGSIGIAMTSTLLSRHTQATTLIYGSNVTALDPTSQSLFAQMRGAFMAAGNDITTATQRAYAAMYGMVMQQASMVSFVGLFQLLGIVFFAVLPLVLLMKRPRAGAGGAAGAH